jgi:nucleotide-binding universal stress UspA family protein
MTLFSRVLVPLDGTPHAEVALTHLRPVLRREGGELVILRAAQLPFVPESGAALHCAHSLIHESADYLAGMAETLRDEGIPTRVVSADGPAHRAILAEARSAKASMIAMTTRGRTGLSRWLMGSVTEQVVRESPLPVWITRSPETDWSGLPGPAKDPLELERILVPLEPAERPDEALSPALEFARIFGARILVLRLLDGNPVEHLSGLAASLIGFRRRGLRFETLVERGDPAAAIAAAARHRQAGLVTLHEPAARGLTGWLRAGLAERVLRAVRVPLLVVRGA